MITAEQRELRKSFIGSSDAAAILGLDPFRSAADVWLEKTGQVDDFEGNDDTRRGTFLEPAILNWAQSRIGSEFERDRMVRHGNGLLAANFDGINPAAGYMVEAKSSVNAEEWGEEGTDQVPERVIVQTHHAMYVAGWSIKTAFVPVLLPGYRSFDFRLYKIERNDELAEQIARQGAAFMREFVGPRIAPEDYRPSIEVLKRIRREPTKVVAVADEIADAWLVARAARLQAEKEEEEAQRQLLTALGDAEAADHAGGRITYMEQARKVFDLKRFEAALPKLAAEYRTETKYRVLRLKAAKGSKQ